MRTRTVDEVDIVGVRRDDGHQVGAGHVQLRQLEEGGAAAPVVLPKEALQVLEAHCANGSRWGSDLCAACGTHRHAARNRGERLARVHPLGSKPH